MSRKELFCTDQFPYSLTNRSNNKDFFYLSMEELWPIFIDVLTILQNEYYCCVHVFVLMSNHYHLILSTPKLNISKAMLYLHREVARLANQKTQRINHFFGGRYKWCVLTNQVHYWNSVKYIFRNPVEARICSNVEDYKFSTLNAHVPQLNLTDFLSNEKYELDLDWLNKGFIEEHRLAIQKALRRREFKLPKDKDRKEIILEPIPPKKLITFI